LGRIRVFVLVLVVFSLGWLLNTVLTNFVYYDAEKPFSFSIVPFMKSPERASPGDHIQESQIHVYNDRVVIDAQGASWAAFTDTNSMDPFFDDAANSIEVVPESADAVSVGDIISYRSSITGDLIVHRVVSKGVDGDGVFYILKGDNNPSQDPEKVRFDQVHGVLIGIIY
jgi:hypothetical protein